MTRLRLVSHMFWIHINAVNSHTALSSSTKVLKRRFINDAKLIRILKLLEFIRGYFSAFIKKTIGPLILAIVLRINTNPYQYCIKA